MGTWWVHYLLSLSLLETPCNNNLKDNNDDDGNNNKCYFEKENKEGKRRSSSFATLGPPRETRLLVKLSPEHLLAFAYTISSS